MRSDPNLLNLQLDPLVSGLQVRKAANKVLTPLPLEHSGHKTFSGFFVNISKMISDPDLLNYQPDPLVSGLPVRKYKVLGLDLALRPVC